MNDKLQIAVRIKKTIIYIEKTLETFPHKYIEIKSLISKTMYEMLEYIYLANTNIEREKNISLSIVKLQMVDFYLLLAYKNELISRKKYEGISKHLLEIKNMMFGYKNYEKIQ